MFLFNARHIINGSSPRAAQVLRSVVQQSFLLARWPWCIYFNIFSDWDAASGVWKKTDWKMDLTFYLFFTFFLLKRKISHSHPSPKISMWRAEALHSYKPSWLNISIWHTVLDTCYQTSLGPYIFFSFQFEYDLRNWTVGYFSYFRWNWTTNPCLQKSSVPSLSFDPTRSYVSVAFFFFPYALNSWGFTWNKTSRFYIFCVLM